MKFKLKLPVRSSNEDGGKKKRSINLKNISPWGVGASVCFLVVLFMLGYFGYLQWQSIRLNQTAKEKESVLVLKNSELKKLTDQTNYQKFQAAKELVNNAGGWDWKESTSYLIDLYDILQSLDDDKSGVTLEQFSVSEDGVNFRGTIDRIEYAYRPGGLIDLLVSLDFIEFIQIPFYNGNADGSFNFILQADIKEYDGNGGTL